MHNPRNALQDGRRPLRDFLTFGGGSLLGLLLSGVQLLPTLELSANGLRSGGLSYQEATSFSLKPLQLGWSLLPSYGLVNLETVFDTPGYTEFVAYIGLAGLLLALLGIWQGRGTSADIWPAVCTRRFSACPGPMEPALLRPVRDHARFRLYFEHLHVG